ncbi:sensor histidine kinase [candidate division KSB1 bacterium]|nr:sensor histidine kinase [candidate division KSB1 bacterium]
MTRASNTASSQPPSQIRWHILIGVLIIMVVLLHYFTPVHLHHLHELYRALFYLPIILAAFRFQLKGGIASSVCIILIYLPHVIYQWGGDFLFNFSRFLEMVMYLVVGMVAGFLAQRELNERIKYQNTAIELERSLQKLKEQSEKLAEIEEQLRASERLSVLGELAASLAHEVRNPLGAIWGAVEILQENFKQQGKNFEFMDILLQEVKRLDKVVENYSNLTRTSPVSLQLCNLYTIVQSVILLMAGKARKLGISLVSDFADQSVLVKADEIQLRQVLINLILNSMAAIREKGTIIIKAESGRALPAEEQQQSLDSIHLSIIDDGEGMTKDVVDKMFKPFFTTKSGGTGMGLGIVKRIVVQNKWGIRVESAPRKGTKMKLIFPAAA